jgi:UDP-3-O-[3-hydroxymyristoyl] glucosamine N-acyltransferase
VPDSRFFESLGPVRLGELVSLTGARLLDAALRTRVIARVASLVEADRDSVAFYSDNRYASDLASTGAGACFLSRAHLESAPHSCVELECKAPQLAFVLAAHRLHRPRRHLLDDGAVASTVELEDGVVLSPGVAIGPGAKIGARTYIGPGAVVGPGVAIGRDGYLGARACVGFALVGDGVQIHAGAVIGEPGFGAVAGPRGIVDIPQLGRVLIQDRVTIGAGSCIDRGALADTVIGEDTKIDNLVQIGHNVRIGRGCVLAAHTGISGSVVIDDGCQFGGRAGLADHIHIGAGARIAAAAGVMHDVPPGESWGGYPAKPVKRWLRETATLARLAQGRPTGNTET